MQGLLVKHKAANSLAHSVGVLLASRALLAATGSVVFGYVTLYQMQALEKLYASHGTRSVELANAHVDTAGYALLAGRLASAAAHLQFAKQCVSATVGGTSLSGMMCLNVEGWLAVRQGHLDEARNCGLGIARIYAELVSPMNIQALRVVVSAAQLLMATLHVDHDGRGGNTIEAIFASVNAALDMEISGARCEDAGLVAEFGSALLRFGYRDLAADMFRRACLAYVCGWCLLTERTRIYAVVMGGA